MEPAFAKEFSKVFGVIVTFNTDDAFASRLAMILPQVHAIILSDNSTDAGCKAQIAAMAAAYPSVILLGNEGNIGLARAQNRGIEAALAQGAGWVLLLDDDSIASPGMVARLLAAYGAYPDPGRIAIVAPNIQDVHAGHTLVRLAAAHNRAFPKRLPVLPGVAYDDTLTVTASGSLVKASILQALGGMEERFFIDRLDIEFSLRLRASGYRILIVGSAMLRHRLGTRREHRLLGRHFVTSNHSARRRYTIHRNRVWIWKRYAARFPGFTVYDMLLTTYEALLIAAFETQKRAKLGALLHGLWDGLRGRFADHFPY